ncbi:hypothetical protein GCK72_023106 [Caenorhabditis remanei]|uniref:Uncharacterized protein n=1 Tax=Caenorhabditis remanei TaxID=31234 RepID=A0A6A5FW63_CAERE|nr:hypothetical protein GCK72_023106 [Caenorhabditis remanei]KAF1746649.1 hypothetical protein GCK72_023106 [Caenorhabditis remanei]
MMKIFLVLFLIFLIVTATDIKPPHVVPVKKCKTESSEEHLHRSEFGDQSEDVSHKNESSTHSRLLRSQVAEHPGYPNKCTYRVSTEWSDTVNTSICTLLCLGLAVLVMHSLSTTRKKNDNNMKTI